MSIQGRFNETCGTGTVGMGFVKKTVRKSKESGITHTQYYYCENIKRDGTWKQIIIRKATAEEIAASNISKNAKKDMAFITCSNPECDRQLKIPRSQKRRFNTTYPLRYKRVLMLYCSRDCQIAHNKVLGTGD